MFLYLSVICSSVLFLLALNQSGKMENIFTQFTLNSSQTESVGCGQGQVVFLSLIDICTLLVGQPVIVRLLWLVLTSKKTTDILNCNLALFLNLEYFMLTLHFFVLFLLPHAQADILEFLFVYAQIGGPMSLSFICIERYVAVTHPTSYPLLKEYRCREVCAVTVWLFSVPIAFASVFVDNVKSSIMVEYVLDGIPIVIMVCMIAVMVKCTVSIAKALKHAGPGRDEMHPIKRRALRTVCATLAIMMFFYIPVTFLQRFKYLRDYDFNCFIIPTCILLLSAASVVHPVFYLSTQGKLFPCIK